MKDQQWDLFNLCKSKDAMCDEALAELAAAREEQKLAESKDAMYGEELAAARAAQAPGPHVRKERIEAVKFQRNSIELVNLSSNSETDDKAFLNNLQILNYLKVWFMSEMVN